MHRVACIDLPAFPLQLLLKRNQEWRTHAACVVTEDRPQGVLLWANEHARGRGVLPGQKYAQALSLASDLRAGMISQEELGSSIEQVASALRKFSPEVESNIDQPGVFWASGAGLERIYKSPARWSRAIRQALDELDLISSIVIGFSRFGSYALARAQKAGLSILRDSESEGREAHRVPIARLDFAPKLRDSLHKLGITTLGGFIRLPAGGILQRFGRQAYVLHQLAAGESWDPVRPHIPADPLEKTILLDDPEINASRLLFATKKAIDDLLEQLATRKAALAALFLDLTLDGAENIIEVIRPAEPTLDSRALLRLLHLRFEASPPQAGVLEIHVSVLDVPATREQLQLFRQKPKRDLRAANQALARVRAEFGNQAIVHAVLRQGHLPEAQYTWQPLTQIILPNANANAPRGSVRRVYPKPIALTSQHRGFRDDGWLLGGVESGSVTQITGPFIVSGGWWNTEIHREYHYAQMQSGDLLWVYYDRRRRRWFLHGHVE